MDAPLIELDNVTKRFGDKTVLDRVNLKIYENQVTTIIGKSGTGKSVLLKHIIGLLNPDEGTILYRGRPLHQMKRREREEYRSRIAYVFQNNALLDSVTVLENVMLPLRQTTHLSMKEIKERARNKIEELDLGDSIEKYPSELSGGMQKRVALARAWVTEPKIVLFDEPTSGLDPIRKNSILSMIAHARRKLGFTAVVISHDIPDIFFISDRVAILWEGRVGFDGASQEALGLKHPIIDEFLRSLEGFEDELTGLLSREVFRTYYGALLAGDTGMPTNSAVLFSVDLDPLQDALGPVAASEVLRFLGEYVKASFRPIGGFSVRSSREQMLTILPHTSRDEAEQLVMRFGQALAREGLTTIERRAQLAPGTEAHLEVNVRAGVTDVSPTDDIGRIIEKACSNQRIVATHHYNLPTGA
ncbi:MAG TPA: ATP-binding cassette domain-containing protein [Syntrophorhabdales bacterium]|nr:ATP-binding cassette domain-containing protein [Syntrophorhabdales bacterium]